MTENFSNVLESFISYCDDYIIADEGVISDAGKRLLEMLNWFQDKLNELWNKFIKYVSSLRQSVLRKCTLEKSNSTAQVNSIISNIESVIRNLETLVGILDYKFKKISHALLYSTELRYDSKDVAMKPKSEILQILDTKYDGIHYRSISSNINEINFDKNNRRKIAQRSITEILESLSSINSTLTELSTNDNFREIYSECNTYMMSLFVPSVQNLKPLKDELNKTITVLKKGVPIYSNNRTYADIIHSIIGNASADWSTLNVLYVRLLNVFKSFENQNNN